MMIGRHLASGAAAILIAASLAGCQQHHAASGSSGLSPVTPTSAPATSATPTLTPAPSATKTLIVPPIRITPHPKLSLQPVPSAHLVLGDLRIRLARTNDCTWYQDTTGALWIAPTLAVSWSGPGALPANLGFSMTTNYGKKTAGGPVHSTAPFTWAIGGEAAAGNAWLGHNVTITVTIDPGNDVAESNEADNTATITVPISTILPTDSEDPIPCS